MADPTAGSITTLISAADAGDAGARERLWTAVYTELRRVAHQQLGPEPAASGLQTTVLVHEAYLRLVGPDGDRVNWTNHRHFFAAAARAMQRIRIDEARNRLRAKRGGGQRPGPLVDTPAEDGTDPVELLAIDEALRKLEVEAPRAAEVVRLRYFAGLSIDEVAHVLGISPSSVDGDWRFARTWLHLELDDGVLALHHDGEVNGGRKPTRADPGAV